MNELRDNIYVTQPVLPDLEEFMVMLEDIWGNKWLTNKGKYHQLFEKALTEYLGVPYVSLFANGTLALISALKILQITGEVITTPYSFVATTHALWWNNIKPVFADIELKSCNICPEKIEAAITPETTAILPVHIYGNPCETEKIQTIADKYGLKIIYDAAHAFGVKVNNKSILNYGDLSVLSFHATKVFNTIEGGAIVCHDLETKKCIDHINNFGFEGEIEVVSPGMNAKMNELQAAYGLLQLKTIDRDIERRKQIAFYYREKLAGIQGINFLEDMENVRHNYSYFPIFINKDKYGLSRDEVYEKLKRKKIYGRRYFYPLISNFPNYKDLPSSDPANLLIAEKLAGQVLCLPIYSDLDIQICSIIVSELKRL